MFPKAVIDCIRQAREPRIDEIHAVAEHMLRDLSGRDPRSYPDHHDPQWHHAVRAARQALTGSQ